MAKFVLLALGLMFYSTATFAQDKMPEAIKEAFDQQYPNASDITYNDNILNATVSFTLNGDKMLATYTKKGVWKNTEKDFTFDQLPDSVKDGFQKSKYADWSVEETKVIYRPGGTERYRIKVGKSDIQKKYLFFNKNGRLVEENITL